MKGEAVSVPARRHRRQRLSSGMVLADDYSMRDNLPLSSNVTIVLAPWLFS